VEVAGESVSLGQVATLRTKDLGLMRKLVDLPVVRAPRLGEELSIDQPRLAEWIGRNAGVSRKQLEWLGAGETHITRKTTRLRGADIASAASRALGHARASGGFTSAATVTMQPADMDLPAGEVRLYARPVQQARLRDRTLVWVEVWAGTAFVRSVAVTFQASSITSAPPSAAPKPQPEAAAPSQPAPPVAVMRGEWASMHTAAGAVALESRVEVLQDGRPGDKVRVRQTGATGIVFARVLSPGQLELAP
jgi:flagella basal body P-ring formation protein FlgA